MQQTMFDNDPFSISDFSSDELSLYSKEPSAITQDWDFIERHNILDMATPLGEPLSAKYKQSFAYKVMRERSPKIIGELMKSLQDNEERIMEQCGSYAHFDLRRVLWSLDILRTELLQNSEFKLFYDKDPVAKDWNTLIKKKIAREKGEWFSGAWLFAECYMYRRISVAFRRTETLKNYDYFIPQKICATRNIVYLMHRVLKATHALTLSLDNFQLMFKLSLWGNRSAQWITKEMETKHMKEIFAENDKHIITDQSEDVWRLLTERASESGGPVVVDLVCDNAGFELFTDLLLAEYLINTGLSAKVRFHVKAIPWFKSQVTAQDFRWMMRFLLRHEIHEMALFGRKMRVLMRNKSVELYGPCDFWTRSSSFKFMRELSPCLYVHLSLGALVIFKGDLNYRKLIDDINWEPTTPFADCLGGFLPTNVCALRPIKSDIYCGLPICMVEWLTDDIPKWMCTGEKAVIQFANKKY